MTKVAGVRLHGGPTCGGKKRQGGGLCTQAAGWGTSHPGVGRCKLHAGSSLVKHGRYSGIKREELRDLVEKHEADPDPLDIFPELAAARALFEDYINRYQEFAAALVAWHESYRASARPVDASMVDALATVLDEFEALTGPFDGERDPDDQYDPESRVRQAGTRARLLLEALKAPVDGKPVQVLDIADAYRILSEVTKIAERIERIRAANAISRPDLMRLMQEMGRVVTHHVSDPAVAAAIKDGWMSIRVA